jgi:hypothetical protein
MKRLIIGGIALLIVGIAIGSAFGSSGGTGSIPSADVAAANQSDGPPEVADVPEPQPEEAFDPEPKGRQGLTGCDLQLSSRLYGQDFLVGETTVKNVGQVPFDARVTAKFLLMASPTIKDAKTVSGLGAGDKVRVKFKIPISGDQVDAFQSHPGYFASKNCSVVAVITS